MDENMIQYIYGNTNAKVSHNRIRWNIKASTEVPTSETEGHLGDIIVVTSADIKKLKYVATKDITDGQLQDNSINIYEDFTKPRILVNKSNGFNMYLQGTMQNILLNGESVIANVYFYDALTGDWVSFSSAYKEALNLNTFTGQNINVDELWNIPEFVDTINEDSLLPTIVKPQTVDNLTILDFTGQSLDVDTLWNNVSFTDAASLRTSSFNENEDIEIN